MQLFLADRAEKKLRGLIPLSFFLKANPEERFKC